MNTNSPINLWQQAQAARSAGNWSLLIQYLQQLTQGEQVSRFSQHAPPIAETEQSSAGNAGQHPTRSHLLDMALEVLVAGDFHQRWDVTKLLPKLAQGAHSEDIEEVIAPLIDILEDEEADEELRWFAARTLGEFHRPTAITALVELLKTSDNEELSAMAAAALGQIGSPAVAALTELLADENTRLLAVRSLSHIRRSETITPLLSVVQDPQVVIRAAAIEALSSFHDPRIPPILVSALDDLAAQVRSEAVIGLSFRPDLREELDLVNRLRQRLYDFNLDVCAAAAIALGRLGTDTAATALFQVLQSPNTPSSLQIEIIRALGRVGTATSLAYLHSGFNQLESATMWQEIVTVLGRVEQPDLMPQAAQILIDVLKSTHPAAQHESVKQAIALSLGQLGEMQAVDPLIDLLADRDAGVRLHAIAALKHLAPEAAHRQLEQMATNEALAPSLKQGVAIALQEWSID